MNRRGEVGRYQRVLRGKMIIERALADADLGGNGVDADGANPLLIEQPVGGLQNPLFHRRLSDGRSRRIDGLKGGKYAI